MDRARFVEISNAVKVRTFENVTVKTTLSSSVLRTDHTKLNKKLETLMATSHSSDPALRVASDRLYGDTRYGLLMDKNRIEILGLSADKK
jgi:hypothetical protein